MPEITHEGIMPMPTGLYPSAQMKQEMQELKALLREALNASYDPPHPFGSDLYERIKKAAEE